jgi:hypothetical protein
MGTLAESILERDKEREGGIVVTMPTTNDAGVAQKWPAPSGKPHLRPSTALHLLGGLKSTPRRRALYTTQTWGFQCAH